MCRFVSHHIFPLSVQIRGFVRHIVWQMSLSKSLSRAHQQCWCVKIRNSSVIFATLYCKRWWRGELIGNLCCWNQTLKIAKLIARVRNDNDRQFYTQNKISDSRVFYSPILISCIRVNEAHEFFKLFTPFIYALFDIIRETFLGLC